MKKALLVLVTVANRKESDKIARCVVDEKLAACVTILPGITSQFRWKGNVQTSRELLLLMKTTPARYKALERRVLELHSYDVPEILAIPLSQGHAAYLSWIHASTK